MSARTRDSTNYVASRISPEDLHLFAVEAVEKVMRIARSAQHKTNRSQAEVVQFCGTLSSVLYSIKSQLQETLESGGEAPKKVESLLNNLERLCSVSVIFHEYREISRVFDLSYSYHGALVASC